MRPPRRSRTSIMSPPATTRGRGWARERRGRLRNRQGKREKGKGKREKGKVKRKVKAGSGARCAGLFLVLQARIANREARAANYYCRTSWARTAPPGFSAEWTLK